MFIIHTNKKIELSWTSSMEFWTWHVRRVDNKIMQFVLNFNKKKSLSITIFMFAAVWWVNAFRNNWFHTWAICKYIARTHFIALDPFLHTQLFFFVFFNANTERVERKKGNLDFFFVSIKWMNWDLVYIHTHIDAYVWKSKNLSE